MVGLPYLILSILSRAEYSRLVLRHVSKGVDINYRTWGRTGDITADINNLKFC